VFDPNAFDNEGKVCLFLYLCTCLSVYLCTSFGPRPYPCPTLNPQP
jgi:hypothetical protein